MKKSISLFIALTIATCGLFAQKYFADDFVGTWKMDESYFQLFDGGKAKVKFADGTTSWGTWDYWEYGYKRLDISLKDSDTKMEVISKNGDFMSVRDVASKDYHTLYRSSDSPAIGLTPAPKPVPKKQSSVDAADAGAFIIGALLLGALLSSGSSDSGSLTSCSTCGGRGTVLSSNCPSGCPCPGCGG